MPRPRERVCLQDGLKLDLNQLACQKFVERGARSGPIGIQWTHSYWGEIASGVISADLSGVSEGWLRMQLGSLDQRIVLLARPRHFGGRQWYFMCPVRNRPVSVLWKPPGATQFCSRHVWGRQVAYASQFMSPADRAWHGKSKINARLCRAGGFDPDEWEFPPKPKHMRWRTYKGHENRFDHYEEMLDRHLVIAMARLTGSGFAFD